MKITKLGHCCLIIEINGVKIMTDPGSYSTLQNEVKDIDAIIISHEHPDHIHLESLEQVLKNNPGIPMYTNDAVGKLLSPKNIPYISLPNNGTIEIKGIKIFTEIVPHAEIHSSVTPVDNSIIIVADELLYPGDVLYKPHQKIKILALPIVAPWLKISEALDYAEKVKPDVCFPVHDGMLVPTRRVPFRALPKKILESKGITFIALEEGQSHDFS
jgi:L-ascorbate metabolism protein UlaG (beta-lactamase superfamily)